MNEHELFNLRHAALQNIIEHLFGVLKHQWHILNIPLEYSMDIQACIPAALCVLHNLVNHFDPEEYEHPEFDWVLTQLDESDGIPTIDDHEEPIVQEGNETVHANHRRDMIAVETCASLDVYLHIRAGLARSYGAQVPMRTGGALAHAGLPPSSTLLSTATRTSRAH